MTHEPAVTHAPAAPAMRDVPARDAPRRRGGGRGKGGRGEQLMVPEAEFSSYYGRPIVKASPWEVDIPVYLFLGGLAGGSSLLAAGADLQGNTALRNPMRWTAIGAIGVSFAALVHDLGKPSRFHHMLRVAKVTSPMSVGTWILTVYGPAAALAAAVQALPIAPKALRRSWIGRIAPLVGRVAGLTAAATAPAVASYTAVLLSDTATPTWHDAHLQLPFVFVGSASAAAGGAGMILAPLSASGPARRLAVGGAVVELAVSEYMEKRMGLSAEPLHTGKPGTMIRAAKACTAAGLLLAVAGRRHRGVSALAGVSLLAGSALTRFGIFYGGQASARDPKYTVVPQRERVDAGRSVRSDSSVKKPAR